MKLKILAVLAVWTIALSSTVILPSTAHAQTGANPAHCGESSGGFLSFPTWYKYLNPSIEDPDGNGPRPASCEIEFEFTGAKIGAVLLAVFEIILRIAALVTIVFVIWGGIQLQLSQGEPDRFSNARTTVINALIGLVVVLSAVAIVNFIGSNLR